MPHFFFCVIHFYAGGAISGILGGSGTMFCGFFSYAADVSAGGSGAHRSLKFAVIEGIQDLGILLGNLAVGWFAMR